MKKYEKKGRGSENKCEKETVLSRNVMKSP